MTNVIMWLIQKWFVVILIVFGCVKIGLSTFELMKDSKDSKDSTLAGKMIYVILCVLGISTLLHGLSIINLTPEWVANLYADPQVHIFINTLFAAFSIIFFTITVETTLIPHRNDNLDEYYVIGIGGGLAFLLCIPIIIVLQSIFHHDKEIFHSINVVALCAFVIIAYALYIISNDYIKNHYGKLLDIMMLSIVNALVI